MGPTGTHVLPPARRSYGNPTTRACEEKIRELEGAEDCLVSSSGMNAATTVGAACCEPLAGAERTALRRGAGMVGM